MKRIFIMAIAAALVSTAATAQVKREHKEGHDRGMKGKHHHGMMMKELNFSDAQKQDMKANGEYFKKQMQELNKNDNMTVKEFREKKAALHKEQKAKFESLLTPEQKEKMSKMKADRNAKREEHFGKGMDKMKSKLNLSDAQVATMKSNHENFKAQFKAIKDDNNLSREAKKEKMETLKKDRKEQMDKVLTKEQKEKMQEFRKKRSEKPAVK